LLIVDGVPAQDNPPPTDQREQLGAVVLQTGTLRLEIGQDGMLRSLTAQAEGVEYCVASPPYPVALVYRGGRMVPSETGESAAVTGKGM
jgi:hypothetical protein